MLNTGLNINLDRSMFLHDRNSEAVWKCYPIATSFHPAAFTVRCWFFQEELKIKMEPLRKQMKLCEEAKVTCEETAKHVKVSMSLFNTMSICLGMTSMNVFCVLNQSQTQHTETKIKEEFEKLHLFLRDEEAARIVALRDEEEQKSEMMKEKIEKMSREISSLSDTIRAIEEELINDDNTFLQVRTGLVFLFS